MANHKIGPWLIKTEKAFLEGCLVADEEGHRTLLRKWETSYGVEPCLPSVFLCFFFNIFIGVQLLYIVVLVAAA